MDMTTFIVINKILCKWELLIYKMFTEGQKDTSKMKNVEENMYSLR